MSAIWHVRLIEQRIPQAPFVRPGGSLLVIVGLPGTGKSLLVEKLQDVLSCVVIRTDHVRLLMRESPRYTASEMVWVYEVCQRIIEMRLRQGQRVVFDGTNYQAARRERLMSVAARVNARIAVAHVQAAEEVIQQRLRDRSVGKRRDGDLSDADWSVYQWMVHAQEPIEGPHLPLDTTSTPPETLARQLRDYWVEREKNGTGDDYLQFSSWAHEL